METYSALFNFFKKEVTRKAIFSKISSDRRRFYLFIAGSLVSIIIILIILQFFKNPYIRLIPFALTITWIAVFVGKLPKWTEHDIVKTFSFTKDEEGSKIHIVQIYKLTKRLGIIANDEGMLNNLINNADERAGTERKLSDHLKELRIGGVLVVFLGIYFTKVFNSWNDSSFQIISLKALVIFLGIVVLPALLFYGAASIYMEVKNWDYRLHKELYWLLKDLETINKQSKIKTSSID
jgi:hypothetical protein